MPEQIYFREQRRDHDHLR